MKFSSFRAGLAAFAALGLVSLGSLFLESGSLDFADAAADVEVSSTAYYADIVNPSNPDQDLALTSTYLPGDVAYLEFTFTNRGDETANNFEVDIPLNAGTSVDPNFNVFLFEDYPDWDPYFIVPGGSLPENYTGTRSTDAGSCRINTANRNARSGENLPGLENITCDFGSLAAGASETVAVAVRAAHFTNTYFGDVIIAPELRYNGTTESIQTMRIGNNPFTQGTLGEPPSIFVKEVSRDGVNYVDQGDFQFNDGERVYFRVRIKSGYNNDGVWTINPTGSRDNNEYMFSFRLFDAVSDSVNGGTLTDFINLDIESNHGCERSGLDLLNSGSRYLDESTVCFIDPIETVEITYEAFVDASSLDFDTPERITNTAFATSPTTCSARYDGTPNVVSGDERFNSDCVSANDTADVGIVLERPRTPILNLDKRVSDTDSNYRESVTLSNGETAFYQIIVRNSGDGEASFILNDALAAASNGGSLGSVQNATVDPSNTCGAGSIASGQLRDCTLGPDSSVTIKYRRSVNDNGVDANSTSNIVNNANVAFSFRPNEPVARSHADVEIEKAGNPQLSIHKDISDAANGTFGDEAEVQDGEGVFYRLVVRNTGNGTGTFVVKDALGSATNGGSLSGITNVTQNPANTCSGGSLAGSGLTGCSLSAGQTLTITYRRTTSEAGMSPNTLSRIPDTAAIALSSSPNTNIDTDTATAIVRRPGVASLHVEKRISDTAGNYRETVNFEDGDTAFYQVVVRNTGSAAGTFVVDDDLGNATNGGSFSGITNEVQNPANTCSGGSLASGRLTGCTLGVNQTLTITYQRTASDDGVPAANSSSIPDTASVALSSSPNTPVDTDTSTGTIGNPGAPNLRVIKEVSLDETNWQASVNLQGGDTAFYRVRFINDGSAAARNLDFTDILAAPNQSTGGDMQPAQNITLNPDVCTSAGNNVANTISFSGCSLNAGQTAILTYSRVANDSQIALGGSSTVTNTAKIDDNIPNNTDPEDEADVVIGEASTPVLTIDKAVSRDGTNFEDPVTGLLDGDDVFYRLVIENQGSGSGTFILKDSTNPLNGGDVTLQADSVTFDPTDACGTGNLENGYTCTLDANESVTVTYTSDADDTGITEGGTSNVENTAGLFDPKNPDTLLRNPENEEIKDDAVVTIRKPGNTDIEVVKRVSKTSSATGLVNEVNALDGEAVYYNILITNKEGSTEDAVVDIDDIFADGTNEGDVINLTSLVIDPADACDPVAPGTSDDTTIAYDTCTIPRDGGEILITYQKEVTDEGMTRGIDSDIVNTVTVTDANSGESLGVDDATVTIQTADLAVQIYVDDEQIAPRADACNVTDNNKTVLTYTVPWQNLGSVIMNNTTVTAKLADTAQLQYIESVEVLGGTYESSTGTITWGPINTNPGDLDGFFSYKVTYTDDLPTDTDIKWDAHIESADFLPISEREFDDTNNDDSITTEVDPSFADERAKDVLNQRTGIRSTSVEGQEGDVLTYTLYYRNCGSDETTHNFSDDISDILEYATVTDLMGGSVSDGTISYPVVTVPAGETASVSFTVTVNSDLPDPSDTEDLVMTNVYDNNVRVQLRPDLSRSKNVQIAGGSPVTNGEAEAGDLLVYTLSVENSAEGAANGYVFADDLNDILIYADIVETNGGVLDDSGILSWEPVTIPGQTTATKEFTVRIKDPLPDTDDGYVATNFFGNPVNVTFTPPTPEGVTLVKTVNPTSLRNGESATFTITINNPLDRAVDFTVTDALPTTGTNGGSLNTPSNETLTISPANSGTATGSVTSQIDVVDLAPGATLTITYVQTVSGVAANTSTAFTNTASIPEANVSDSATVTAQNTVTVTTSSSSGGSGGRRTGSSSGGNRSETIELSVKTYNTINNRDEDAETVGDKSILACQGDSLIVEHKTTVRNSGNADAQDVVIEDVFAGTVFDLVEIYDVEGATYDEDDGTFTFDEVGANSLETVTFTALYEKPAGSVCPTNIGNSIATIESAETESSSTTIRGIGDFDRRFMGTEEQRIDVTLGKSADKRVVEPGEEFTYTITVFNRGNETLRDLSVRDLFPSDRIEILDAGQGQVNGSLITFSLPQVNPNTPYTFQIRARAKEEGIAVETDTLNMAELFYQGEEIAKADALVTITVPEQPPLPETGSSSGMMMLLLLLLLTGGGLTYHYYRTVLTQ